MIGNLPSCYSPTPTTDRLPVNGVGDDDPTAIIRHCSFTIGTANKKHDVNIYRTTIVKGLIKYALECAKELWKNTFSVYNIQQA